jgi:hypothetical protein
MRVIDCVQYDEEPSDCTPCIAMLASAGLAQGKSIKHPTSESTSPRDAGMAMTLVFVTAS